jgi:hypothetical protein
MRRAGTQVKKDYESTTATWRHKPRFVKVVSLMAPGPTLLVGTDDEIYGYVEEGTRPHIILPRRAKALRFKTGYKAKTRPGVIGSFPGGASGPVVFSQGVLHPGTKPRDFSKKIQEKREKWFRRQMEAAMRNAVQKSGHAL